MARVAASVAKFALVLLGASSLACERSPFPPPPPGPPGSHPDNGVPQDDDDDDDGSDPTGTGTGDDDDDGMRPDMGDPDDSDSGDSNSGDSDDTGPDTGTDGGIWGPCDDPDCPPGWTCYEDDGSLGRC